MKNFDEIILELPEVNLNEKRTRFGGCDYGRDPWGNCYDMAEVVVTGSSGGNSNFWNSSPGSGSQWSQPSGGSGSSGGSSGAPDIHAPTGSWEPQPCLACSDLESPRPTFQRGLGTLLLGNMHREGCGGQYRPELRHKVWVPCE